MKTILGSVWSNLRSGRLDGPDIRSEGLDLVYERTEVGLKGPELGSEHSVKSGGLAL